MSPSQSILEIHVGIPRPDFSDTCTVILYIFLGTLSSFCIDQGCVLLFGYLYSINLLGILLATIHLGCLMVGLEENSSNTKELHIFLDTDEQDPNNDPDVRWWIKELSLYEEDKEILLSGKELNDSLINATQCLWKSKFLHICGFQITLLSHHLAFKAIDVGYPSIQILHTGKYVFLILHW